MGVGKISFVIFSTLFALSMAVNVQPVSNFETTFAYRSPSGRPLFLRGNFGFYDSGRPQAYIKSISELLQMPIDNSVTFTFIDEQVDSVGVHHAQFQQYFYGIEVDGGKLKIHFDPDTRSVFAITASLLPDPKKHDFAMPQNLVDSHAAIRSSLFGAKDIQFHSDPSIVYLLHEEQGFLAYRAVVSYVLDGEYHYGKVFASLVTGGKIMEFTFIHNALNRTIYNVNHKTRLPGTVVRTEGQIRSTDSTVNQAYDNAGVCYDFYKSKFNRDSWDGKGGPLISSVHYENNYNNAFWNGEQMVYGDGDGVSFSDFAGDTSVVCHELTHAVVQATANLRYVSQSGALNEGWADAMGVSAVHMVEGGDTPTRWMVGHHCYLEGEALRYMNNPPLDGVSYDWYPTRYTGILDNGGVHWNSGIANLAYSLLTDGGSHPQDKSSIYVNGIGWEKSEQIWYSGLSYMVDTTDFSGARAATETAASKLYPSQTQVQTSTSNAWAAVGVPSTSETSDAPFIFRHF